MNLLLELSYHSINFLFRCMNLLCNWFSEFSNERERVERKEHFHKMRMRKLFTEDFLSYFEWIGRAGNIATYLLFL